MRTLLLCLLALGLATTATAQKTPVDDGSLNWARESCSMQNVCIELDLSQFIPQQCDAEYTPVWEYGPDSTIPQQDCYGNEIGNVLGTVLNGNYPNDSGERVAMAESQWFDVTESCYLMEVCHYYDIETSYDGGNIEVNGVVAEPVGGYPDDQISDSDSYYAWCVNNEPGFTGHDPTTFVTDCFDLTPWMGQSVQIAFVFGSDSSVNYPGWYIASVRVGSDVPVPADGSTWGKIKTRYR